MIALWSNEDDDKLESLKLKAFDIQDNKLKYDGELSVNRIYTTFSQKYYDKRKDLSDIQDGILLGLNGLEAPDSVKND